VPPPREDGITPSRILHELVMAACQRHGVPPVEVSSLPYETPRHYVRLAIRVDPQDQTLSCWVDGEVPVGGLYYCTPTQTN
jgi:hypothetical protein